jgi:hypothetical protein
MHAPSCEAVHGRGDALCSPSHGAVLSLSLVLVSRGCARPRTLRSPSHGTCLHVHSGLRNSSMVGAMPCARPRTLRSPSHRTCLHVHPGLRNPSMVGARPPTLAVDLAQLAPNGPASAPQTGAMNCAPTLTAWAAAAFLAATSSIYPSVASSQAPAAS